jgi:hypothetical protein
MTVADDSITSGKIKDGEVKPADIQSGIIVNAWNVVIGSYSPEWTTIDTNWEDVPNASLDISPTGGKLIIFVNISGWSQSGVGNAMQLEIDNGKYTYNSPPGNDGYAFHSDTYGHNDVSFSHILDGVEGVSNENPDKYDVQLQVKHIDGTDYFRINHHSGISILILELKN